MEEEQIDTIPVKIIDEGKQLVVRFPLALKEEFEIDPEKDGFTWVIKRSEDGVSLSGALIKGANIKKDEKKN